MEGDRRSNGNHPGIIDYKGNTYVFGFNYDIHFSKISQHYERRSIGVEKLTFNRMAQFSSFRSGRQRRRSDWVSWILTVALKLRQ